MTPYVRTNIIQLRRDINTMVKEVKVNCQLSGKEVNKKDLNKYKMRLMRRNSKFVNFSCLDKGVVTSIQDRHVSPLAQQELVEFFTIECGKICFQNHLTPATERVILGRLGLVSGDVESYAELSKILSLPPDTLKKWWSRHGKDIQDCLKDRYFA